MTGREIFERFTDVDFALKAEIFAEQGSFSFDHNYEAAIEFLILYCVLLETKNKPYNEEQFLSNYTEFRISLKENGFISLHGKIYRVVEDTCSVE